ERDERQVDAGEAAYLTRPLSCSVDDDLGTNLSGGRFERPVAALPADASDGRVTADLHPGRAAHERVRQSTRIDVAVGREVCSNENPARLEERIQPGQALRGDELDRHANEFGHRRALAELLDPIARRGEAHAAAG